MPRPNRIWFHKQSQAWVTEISGRRYKLAKGRDQKKAAEVKFHELMLECSLNPPVDSGPQFVTAAALVDEYLDLACKGNAPRTFYEKKLILLVFARELGARLVKDLKPYHLERWVADHPEWVSGDTKAKVVSNVQAVFNWSEKRGLIPKNPFNGLVQAGGNRRRPMKGFEFRKIWAQARLGKKTGPWAGSGRRFREMLLFMKLTGARPKEARDLRWDGIDLDHDLAVLKEHKTSHKTDSPRVIVMVERVVGLLRSIRERDGDSGNVFKTVYGKPWSRNAPSQKLSRLRAKGGVAEDAVLYGLRHRFGTVAVLRGLDLKIVATLMGHQSVRTTERYIHVAKEYSALKKAMSQATTPAPRGPKA
jgi:integrase